MAYNDFDLGRGAPAPQSNQTLLKANGADIELPNAAFIKNADLLRDGMDLTLQTSDQSVTIENYFSSETSPNLTAPGGAILTPNLVNSFVKSSPDYASNPHLTDESPVGAVDEVTGDATITRTDGSTETISIGTHVYQGDIIETNSDGAVNITFTDDSSFAVSEDARLAIDEYVFDPSTESGQTDFSVLKGVFVYTSGLIGRDDPDDVTIDTPVGSIGIRGTIIAGDVDSGEITVVEGAIVLRDFNGGEVTLATQFETAKFGDDGQSIKHMGELSAADVASKFVSVSNVSPDLFSSINDAVTEEQNNAEEGAKSEETTEQDTPEAQAEQSEKSADSSDTTEEKAELELPETKAESKDTIAEAKAEALAEAKQAAIEAKAEKAEAISNRIAELKADQQETKEAIIEQRVALLKSATTFNENQSTDALDQTEIEDTGLLQGYGFTAKADADTAATASKILTIDIDQLFDNTTGNTTYSLTEATEDLLNNLINGSSDKSLLDSNDALNGQSLNNGWEFDSATGELKLYINEGADITDGLDTLTIEAIASTGGNNTGLSFTLNLYDTGNEGITGGIGESDVTYVDSASLTLFNPSENVNTIIVKDGIDNGIKDAITILEQQNKTIFTGEEGKKVTIDSASDKNTIFAGNESNDEVILENTNNDIYALGGDDVVTIDLGDETNTTLIDVKDYRIDGGAGTDTLKLFNSSETGDQSIDFTNANFETLKNFETLDLVSAAGKGDITITLGVDDVISLTDSDNILKIDGDADNVINAEGFTDTGTDTGGYDIWEGTGSSGETVRLLIEPDITTINAAGTV